MTKTCFKHPLLVNPVKWLSNNKYHYPELYQTSYYDTDSMSSNPFAHALTETRMDGSRIRFPKGQMVQIVVDTDPESIPITSSKCSNDKNYFLLPLINKPEQNSSLYPSHYILKSQYYIDYIVKTNQWRKYIPQKFRFKNDKYIGMNVNLLPDIAKIIPQIYEQNVIKLISGSKYTEKTGLIQESGFILNFDSALNDPIISFDNSFSIINIHRIVSQDDGISSRRGKLFIPFNGNVDLNLNILSLVSYYS